MLISRAFQDIYGLLCSRVPSLRYFSLSVKILHQKSTKKKEKLHVLPFFSHIFS